MRTSRRNFLAAAAAIVPLGLAAGVQAQPTPVCANPATLPLSQKSKRRSLGYAEPSNQPGKTCGGCAFFAAAAAAGCGTCSLLAGPVAAAGVCTSFAPKP